MTRRLLIKWGLSLLAVMRLPRGRLFAQTRGLAAPDVSALEEVAEAALPRSLGREGTNATVGKFLRWLENYRAGVEMSPGYGIPRTRLTPALDISAYAPQLRALRDAMSEQDREPSGDSLETKKQLIQASLREAGVEGLPNRPDGRHVVADLLSFYLRSSEASDLCYEAEIGRYTCPGLSRLGDKPAPLTKQ